MDPRASDAEILGEARRRGAVVISHDQDFTAILAVTGATSPSLINVRTAYVDEDRLAEAIAGAIRAAEPDLRSGAIVTIADSGARIHRLPIA